MDCWKVIRPLAEGGALESLSTTSGGHSLYLSPRSCRWARARSPLPLCQLVILVVCSTVKKAA
eukprot:scaffold54284_cov15-Prasinocladus_malaysianus.AAC.1